MKILIISDAWAPQINGVVRTVQATIASLETMGHDILVIGPTPNHVFSFALPFYPEILLEFGARARIEATIKDWQPDFIHIATEGPLGWTARALCRKIDFPISTSYHTRFPEYLAARSPSWAAHTIQDLTYTVLRRFHRAAYATLVATSSLETELQTHGFFNLHRWSRGVDTTLFRPNLGVPPAYQGLARPILLYVGRVATEKNLPEFLKLQTKGSLVVIGDGPDLLKLRQAYPKIHFLGALQGEKLAQHYAAADLFVFPSTTDTFGLVLLEACAAGLRVAAYPAPGPRDIFAPEICKSFTALSIDLQTAVDKALDLPADHNAPRQFADTFSWHSCTRQFLAALQSV